MIGTAGRAPGHHPPRREDDLRRHRGDRAEDLGGRAQGLRRRPLRDGRARPSSPTPASRCRRASIAVMGPQAAINAVFYNQLQAIEDDDERAATTEELRASTPRTSTSCTWPPSWSSTRWSSPRTCATSWCGASRSRPARRGPGRQAQPGHAGLDLGGRGTEAPAGRVLVVSSLVLVVVGAPQRGGGSGADGSLGANGSTRGGSRPSGRDEANGSTRGAPGSSRGRRGLGLGLGGSGAGRRRLVGGRGGERVACAAGVGVLDRRLGVGHRGVRLGVRVGGQRVLVRGRRRVRRAAPGCTGRGGAPRARPWGSAGAGGSGRGGSGGAANGSSRAAGVRVLRERLRRRGAGVGAGGAGGAANGSSRGGANSVGGSATGCSSATGSGSGSGRRRAGEACSAGAGGGPVGPPIDGGGIERTRRPLAS